MDCRSLVLGLWLLISTLPTISHACSCVVSNQTGFVHAGEDLRLPSNAKGVLFLAAENDLWRDVTAQSFQIRQHDNERPLSAEIRWLDIEDQMGSSQKEIKRSKERNGLFRVSPVGGFLEGKTYTIRFSDGIRHSSMYADSITFATEQPLPITSAADFRLNIVGSPSGRLLEFPAGGICSEERGVVAQDLLFSIPENYRPYSRYLLQFVDYRMRRGSSTPDESKFKSWIYRPSMCSQIGFGKSQFGPAKDVFASSCVGQGPESTVDVRGFVGFLEMEDQLHATKVVEIDFSKVDRSECSRHRFLKEVVDSGDEERISNYLCSISKDRKELFQMSGNFLNELANLTRSKNKRTSMCAIEAIVTGTQWLEKMPPDVDQVLANIIGTDHLAVCWVNDSLRRRYVSADAPKPQTIAPALQAKLVSLRRDADEKTRSCASSITYSLLDRVQELDSTATPMYRNASTAQLRTDGSLSML